MSDQLKTVAMEVGKTALGFGIGRTVVVMGEKVLKVHEEADSKKKKMKEVGVGAAVALAGTLGTTKVPKEYKSITGGIAAAGAISAISPFGKPDKGFIPVLNGTDEPELVEEINSLSDTTELDEYLNNDLDTEIDTEIEEESQINALASPESEEVMDVDFSEVN